MNEYIHEMNRNRILGNKLKQQWQTTVGWTIAAAGLKNRCFEHPVIIRYNFYEPNRKRDKSNIGAFAIKVIEDALQDMCVIKNDNWAGVAGFEECFFVDKKNPRIEVEIQEILEMQKEDASAEVDAYKKGYDFGYAQGWNEAKLEP